jgi:phospholipid-binding lipoprotein MlaA
MNFASSIGWTLALVLALIAAPRRAPAQLILPLAGAAEATTAATSSTDDEEDDEFEDEYASVTANVSDPFERVNRTMFKFNTSVYDHVLRPVSRGYETVVPAVARRGLGSFYQNLHFPVRFVSCVLQGKLDRAAAETGKFALNTTVGVAGFIKVSDRFPKLRVPEEDLGQAFGAWGIPPGPFLVLPVLGPASVRDGIGRIGDYYLTPTHWDYLDHYDRWVEVTLQAGDFLTGLPDMLKLHDSLRRAALDPYIAFRNAYLQYREGEVKQ